MTSNDVIKDDNEVGDLEGGRHGVELESERSPSEEFVDHCAELDVKMRCRSPCVSPSMEDSEERA